MVAGQRGGRVDVVHIDAEYFSKQRVQVLGTIVRVVSRAAVPHADVEEGSIVFGDRERLKL